MYVEVDGGTNHAAALSGNSCVDDLIANYLATGELPERQGGKGADVLCDPPPLPAAEPATETYAQQSQATRQLEQLKRTRPLPGRR